MCMKSFRENRISPATEYRITREAAQYLVGIMPIAAGYGSPGMVRAPVRRIRAHCLRSRADCCGSSHGGAVLRQDRNSATAIAALNRQPIRARRPCPQRLATDCFLTISTYCASALDRLPLCQATQ